MPYRFALERMDYSDFAAGKVFQSFPNSPFFPVRLSSEIFQRCIRLRTQAGFSDHVVVYDPCVGGGYLLSTLAVLHWEQIDWLIGSDIDPAATELSRRNLALLTVEGLDARLEAIEALHVAFQKSSHAEALESGKRLKSRIVELNRLHSLNTDVWAADALNHSDIAKKIKGRLVDVVITDVPYGHISEWHIAPSLLAINSNPTWHLLESLLPILKASSVVAISANKTQRVAHEQYQRLEHFQLGKRRITFLRPRDKVGAL